MKKTDHVGPATTGASDRVALGRIFSPTTRVLFDGKKLPTKIHDRAALLLGKRYSGPAIITEYSATTVIPPRAKFYLDRAANLLVSLP
jgi:N-methylhydantoinase A/oxoprolinase/acetone carboxylase beta subunit